MAALSDASWRGGRASRIAVAKRLRDRVEMSGRLAGSVILIALMHVCTSPTDPVALPAGSEGLLRRHLDPGCLNVCTPWTQGYFFALQTQLGRLVAQLLGRDGVEAFLRRSGSWCPALYLGTALDIENVDRFFGAIQRCANNDIGEYEMCALAFHWIRKVLRRAERAAEAGYASFRAEVVRVLRDPSIGSFELVHAVFRLYAVEALQNYCDRMVHLLAFLAVSAGGGANDDGEVASLIVSWFEANPDECQCYKILYPLVRGGSRFVAPSRLAKLFRMKHMRINLLHAMAPSDYRAALAAEWMVDEGDSVTYEELAEMVAMRAPDAGPNGREKDENAAAAAAAARKRKSPKGGARWI